MRRLIHHSGSSSYRGRWSPDGESIVFASNRDGSSEIYSADADGGNVVRLTRDPGSANAPDWAAGG